MKQDKELLEKLKDSLLVIPEGWFLYENRGVGNILEDLFVGIYFDGSGMKGYTPTFFVQHLAMPATTLYFSIGGRLKKAEGAEWWISPAEIDILEIFKKVSEQYAVNLLNLNEEQIKKLIEKVKDRSWFELYTYGLANYPENSAVLAFKEGVEKFSIFAKGVAIRQPYLEKLKKLVANLEDPTAYSKTYSQNIADNLKILGISEDTYRNH